MIKKVEGSGFERVQGLLSGSRGELAVDLTYKYVRDGRSENWVFDVRAVKSAALEAAIKAFAVSGRKVRSNLTPFGNTGNEGVRPLYKGYFLGSAGELRLLWLLPAGREVKLKMRLASDLELLESAARNLPVLFAGAVKGFAREEGHIRFKIKPVVVERVSKKKKKGARKK